MDVLKNRRKTIKAKLTRVSTYCASAQATANGIRARCDKIDEYFREFENVQDEIESLLKEPEIENEIQYRSQVEEVYYELKALCSQETSNEETVRNTTTLDNSDHFREVIESLARNQASLGTLVERIACTTPTIVSTPIEQINQQITAQLPRIRLPEFDGAHTDWLRFRDLFESLIHNRTNISNIEKFEYLQSHVKGEAGSIIKHLGASNENYEVAWNLIKNKFNNSDLIRKNYLQLLFDQPPMKTLCTSELKRIINNTNESVNALTAMNEPVTSWDTILIFHLEKKLDIETQTLWCRTATECNTFANFMKFLELRLREVENYPANKFQPAAQNNKPRSQSNVYTTTTKNCPVCQQKHYIYQCEQFRALNTNERINVVKRSNMCFNCLHYDHTATNCKRSKCKYCNNKHNTLLHRNIQDNNHQNSKTSESNVNFNNIQDNNRQNSTTLESNVNFNTRNITTISTTGQKLVTVLPTAIVMLQDANNEQQPCRILLDTGAQATLISEDCVRRLNLKRNFDKTLLTGIGKENGTYTRGKVQINISSRNHNHSIKTQALCVTKLTLLQPAVQLSDKELQFFKQLNLADTQCNTPGQIDIILGADNYSKCFMNEKIDHPTASLSAISTIFGWVVIGNMSATKPTTISISHVSIDDQLQRFWLMEEIEEIKQQYTQEEQLAEEHYQKTFCRDETGRYVVRLPVKDSIQNLENIRSQAIKRLFNMESKLSKNKQLHHDYHAFMNEYQDLSHMEVLKNENAVLYHLPHHAVIKQESTTTKLRVVFDGSAKCSNGTSLNDHLLVGPMIQNDIFSILLQFRKHKVAIAGDIEKMYRQIVVHPIDRAYQCIVWRSNVDEKIRTYQLNTITYGTSAAPFLATRTLYQIALDNQDEYPEISNYIKNNFYVDDFMTCTPDVESAIQLKTTLCKILKQAGFNLRKWSSNNNSFLNSIENTEKAPSSKTIIDNSQTVKTLGLLWKTDSDHFKYNVSTPELPINITKRLILSIISRIFDPLGLIAPFTITMKIFMQKVWIRGGQWDSLLPDDLQKHWNDIYTHINKLQDIQVPRWLQFKTLTQVQLHGFADASEWAYAAAVYLMVIHDNGTTTSRLIAAKTKVSPIKQVTIPRLELSACHLLSKLMKKITNILNIPDMELFGWTDSTIVLSWLADHPRRWNNFVANRTALIINVVPPHQWRHIPTKSNPADCATRGLSPTQLKDNDLWWYGPTNYMKNVKHQQNTTNYTTDLEKRNLNILHFTDNKHEYLLRYSSFTKLIRITALIYRFIHNCNPKNSEKLTGFLSSKDLENAHDALVKQSQQLSYNKEIEILKKGQQLPSQHKLSTLAPFLDEKGLLRVGGRLVNAKLSYNQKHPLIIHKDSFLTEIIVRYYHLHFLHAGPRQLQYLLGLRYWIISVIYVIKKCVYKCPTCMRHRSKPCVQQMGNLPKSRLETMSAFHNVGIDFAGPMFIRSWKGRGSKQYKVWISVFVCLSTKAMHLELVTELSTDAFIAALRRFIARRGIPGNIYSDNGTNFVGCNNKLREFFQFMNNIENQDAIARETANKGIQWHFSPPSGPHFGGIWEAGVKATKYHLYRVLGNASVTYEEMSTILCQIESCLNSRPLTAKYEGDIDPLTPAHFLIMKPMQALPDNDYKDISTNRLNRWQYLQKLTQAFWKKWSTDYLTQLQSRPKWKLKSKNLKINDVVLIKEDTAPNKWCIGKIINTHPGDDGLVRVVTVKTQKGTLKRPITKCCPLLIDI